ncbi:hypothetical protein RvY_15511 [Ramazzottius varieornatus]|uniref:Uncharacterized protein n=1 Tax=Ramazzottius varieornatus TaxID=947166 RepID=A0A1D1VYE9_RAMVA|nr:hypothetical protein RvY_15511 [Ramazzottius varieornatus]
MGGSKVLRYSDFLRCSSSVSTSLVTSGSIAPSVHGTVIMTSNIFFPNRKSNPTVQCRAKNLNQQRAYKRGLQKESIKTNISNVGRKTHSMAKHRLQRKSRTEAQKICSEVDRKTQVIERTEGRRIEQSSS